LRFAHLHGPLKQFNRTFQELIDGDPNPNILERVRTKKIEEMDKEINKYVGKAEEEIGGFKPVINHLLLEEGIKNMEDDDDEMPPIYLHHLEEDE
jgi:hypothetical protein